MILRPYQSQLIADIRGSIRQGHKNVLAVLPTGGGKTVIASFLAKSTSERGRPIFFICHRDFLVHQTALTFEQNGLDFGFVAAGQKMLDRPVMVCSIDTLKNRLDLLDVPDVTVWDEAHHLRAASWLKVHAWTGDNVNIGLTATPERLDGKGLNPPFDDMVIGPTTGELMEMGMLSQYVAFAPSTVDLSEVRTVAGEYSAADLDEALGRSLIMGDIVKTYAERARGTRAVYFCHKVEASKALAESFRNAGFRALHIDGDTPTKDRTKAAILFADGHLDVLTNCALMGEGYDLAAQAGRDVTIETVGLCRPTQSRSLHRQQMGRALRPKDYPAIILDHVGNLERHGLPDSDIDWNLFGRQKQAEKKMTKTCDACLAVVKIVAKACPCCGHVFSGRGPQAGPEHVDAELVEVDKEMLRELEKQKRAQRMAEEARCQTHEDYIELGRKRGYSPKWAHMRWREVKERLESQARSYLRDYEPAA